MFETIFARLRFAPRMRLVVVLAAVGLLVAGCGRSTPPPAARSGGVVVTIFPLFDLVRQVAGPGVEVTLLLPPGVSEHGYSPSPANVKALNDAALLVANGGGIDDWIAPAYRDRAGEGLKLVHLMATLGHDLGEFDAAEAHEHADAGEDHEHAPGTANPHVWLVPLNASKLVAAVAKQLKAIYPDRAADIDRREIEVQQQLAALDVAYEDALAPITDRRLITFHDAFNMLADQYNLEIVGTVITSESHDPTPARVQEVRRRIEKDGVRAVFVEPQFDARAIEGLSGEVKPRVLDPLGDPNRPGYESYDAMMRTNLRNLVEGLRANTPSEQGGG